MNLNATPETLRAVSKALALAAVLDDRVAQPDKARIAAWAEQIDPYKFTEEDMLEGVSGYYSGPVDRAIGIGDLIHHSKLARVERTAREPREVREARQEALAVKAAEDFEALAERKGIPADAPMKFTRRGQNPALTVTCPWCKAGAGRPCHFPSEPTEPTAAPHPSRVELANTKASANV